MTWPTRSHHNRVTPYTSKIASAQTTDIPSLTNWGEPVLVGPGSIHVAHTEHEHVEKAELEAAVDVYCEVARKLLG